MNKPPAFWQLWRNPILWRYATSRLRRGTLLGWGIPLQALGAFCWLITFLGPQKYGTATAAQAAVSAWVPILVLQGIIWMMKGTFSVAVGIAKEGSEGLTDAQRLTPLSASSKVLGYLFGLPIQETVLTASLLPWAVASILWGHIPLMIALRIYLLLTTAAVLHHAIGLVTGTVIRQKIVAGTVSQLLVIFLHFIVPAFATLGAGPLGHLGVESSIAVEFLPLISVTARKMVGDVRFFQFHLSLTLYQWLVMTILLGFLLAILWRRWKRADSHLLSKPLTLAFFAWLLVMGLGEILPMLREGDLFGAKGKLAQIASVRGVEVPDALVRQGFTALWAAAFGCGVLLAAMLATMVITPTMEQHRCARHALRNGSGRRMGWAGDARSAVPWVVGLGLLAVAGWYFLVHQALESSLLAPWVRSDVSIPLVLTAGLLAPLLAWSTLLELAGKKAGFFALFLFWILPLMVVIVALLSGSTITAWPRWVVATSGFSLPLISLLQCFHAPEPFQEIPDSLRGPWWFAMVANVVLVVGLYVALKKAQRGAAEGPPALAKVE